MKVGLTMKILFITLRALEINSSVTISNLGIIKGLTELGYKIDLLMPQVSDHLEQYDPLEEIPHNVNIIYIKSNSTYEKLVTGKTNRLKDILVNILRKIFYKFSLHDNTISLVKKVEIFNVLNEEKYDIVISTSDPKTSHIFTKNLIKKGLNYDYWIQHWGDPLSIDITKTHIYPNWFIRLKEKQIFSCSDLIVYVSPLTEKVQKKLFPKYANRMFFLPLPYYKVKLHESTANKKTTIGYFGDYNSKVRDILPLYNFCLDNPDFNLVIAGNTDLKLEEKKNIRILPRVKQEELYKLEATCDILACVCNKKGTQIPGKIYYYSATNKPILVMSDGEYRDEIKKFLSQYNRFHICDNNSLSINQKVFELLNQNNNCALAPCPEFSASNIAKELLAKVEIKMRGFAGVNVDAKNNDCYTNI